MRLVSTKPPWRTQVVFAGVPTFRKGFIRSPSIRSGPRRGRRLMDGPYGVLTPLITVGGSPCQDSVKDWKRFTPRCGHQPQHLRQWPTFPGWKNAGSCSATLDTQIYHLAHITYHRSTDHMTVEPYRPYPSTIPITPTVLSTKLPGDWSTYHSLIIFIRELSYHPDDAPIDEPNSSECCELCESESSDNDLTWLTSMWIDYWLITCTLYHGTRISHDVINVFSRRHIRPDQMRYSHTCMKGILLTLS